MKGGFINPPNGPSVGLIASAVVGFNEGRVYKPAELGPTPGATGPQGPASMKGGFINPPNALELAARLIAEHASMKGGFINPPNLLPTAYSLSV